MDPDCQAIENQLREFLGNAPEDILVAYLFGSIARRDARPRSDVDVALLLRQSPPSSLEGAQLDLEGVLERVLGRRVQLILLNSAPADLVHRVLRDGRIVLERDRAARIAFEVRLRNEYFDLAPLRRRYRHRDVGDRDSSGVGEVPESTS
jgi:predicted nucleotidyltransferase